MGTAVHQQVLDAARAITRARPDGTFLLCEVLEALPHLNPGTVRTHVASRCCTNAPAHHASRWPYFRALSRARYRIEPRYRRPTPLTADETPWQERLLSAIPSGVDSTLIAQALRWSPTERLERMRRAAEGIERLRSGGRHAPRLR